MLGRLMGNKLTKSSSSLRGEASTSGTKKGTLSLGNKRGEETIQEDSSRSSRLQNGNNRQLRGTYNCSGSALQVKRVELAQPAITISNDIETHSNDELIVALALLRLSNQGADTNASSNTNLPPASGPGLPQPGQIEPHITVYVMNKNLAEFRPKDAKDYRRSA